MPPVNLDGLFGNIQFKSDLLVQMAGDDRELLNRYNTSAQEAFRFWADRLAQFLANTAK